jgi:VWFA-related protein
MNAVAVLLRQPWVTRAGWTLLHFLWQGSAIAIFLAAAQAVAGRRVRVQDRYALACGALAAMIAAPILTFLALGRADAPDFPRPLWPIVVGAAWERALPLLVLAWSTGVVIFSVRIAFGWRRAVRMRRRDSGPVPPAWRQTLAELKLRLRVSAPVRLLSSSLTSVPAVVGWFRPVILLPVEAMTGMPIEQVRALLAHELAHVVRQDYLVNILQSMAEALLFYHPAVWWVSSQIRLDRELCCDDLAVAASGDVLAYATALADLDCYRRGCFQVAQMANGGSLLHRIRRLAGNGEPLTRSMLDAGAASALVVLFMAGIGAVAVHGEPAPTAPWRAAVRPFVPTGTVAARPMWLPAPPRILARRAPRLVSALLFDPLLAPSPIATPETRPAIEAKDALSSALETVAGNSATAPMVGATVPPSHLPAPRFSGSAVTPDTSLPSAAPKFAHNPLPDRKMVEVNIVATDGKGAPAGDLTAADFRAWDNGKEQTIAGLQKVSSVTVAAPAALPPNTYSNRVAEAGQPQVLSMVLLDGPNTTFQDQMLAWRAVKNVVGQQPPEEPVAIYSLGADFAIHIVNGFSFDPIAPPAEFPTRDKSDFLKRVRPGESLQLPALKPFLEKQRILNTLKALETVAEHVKGIPGRKNLLWLSAAFPTVVGAQGSLYFEQFGQELQHTTAAMNDAGVSVYPIDSRGLSSSGGSFTNIATMKSIAEATGGKAFYNRNDIAHGIRAALDDSRQVYLLTYSPPSPLEDGARHTIRVTSSRRGVRLRYRQSYDAPSKSETGSAEAERLLTEALASPLDASETGIQASVEPAAGQGGDITLAVHIDLGDINLAYTGEKLTGGLRLEARQLGASGELLGGVSQAAEFELDQANYRLALQNGLPFAVKLRRELAAVAVRIAVVDARGGRTGSLSLSLPPKRN